MESRDLSVAEFTAYCDALRGVYKVRDKLFAYLATCTGYRISELILGVTLGDLVNKKGEINTYLFIDPKFCKRNRKREHVKISEKCHPLIRAWAATMAAYGNFAADCPVFCTLNGKKLQRTAMNKIMKATALRAKINPVGVSPHSFRKIYAREIYHDACRRRAAGEHVDPIAVVQAALGHTSRDTTMKYLKFLFDREMVEPSLKAVGDFLPVVE